MKRLAGLLTLFALALAALPAAAEGDGVYADADAAPDAAAAPAATPAKLPGKTYEFHYDGKDVRRPKLAWSARAYVTPEAAAAGKPLPLVVFLHGTNKKLIKYRWMGGGQDPDLRAVIGDLVKRGVIEPVIIAAPSSVVKSQVSTSSWDYFDLDKFVARTEKALGGAAQIDATRIIVAGHSGAGCSTEGGLATISGGKRRVHAILSIDTCMRTWLAHRLSHAGKRTHVVATYQTVSWTDRPFDEFREAFAHDATLRPVEAGIERTVEEIHPERPAHQATVALTFERWLPKLLATPAASARTTLPAGDATAAR
jgi:hypothetical protein